MAFGPGKYDDELTEVRQKTGGTGALLLIVEGTKGTGFSAQLSGRLTRTLPAILRSIADQIEDQGPGV